MAIYMGDKGVKIELEFRDYEEVNGKPTDIGALDIRSATEITFLTRKPDGTSGTAKTKGDSNISFTTDGQDGKAYYLIEEGFLDQAGTWRLQGLVALLTGARHYSEIVSFKVQAHL